MDRGDGPDGEIGRGITRICFYPRNPASIRVRKIFGTGALGPWRRLLFGQIGQRGAG